MITMEKKTTSMKDETSAILHQSAHGIAESFHRMNSSKSERKPEISHLSVTVMTPPVGGEWVKPL